MRDAKAAPLSRHRLLRGEPPVESLGQMLAPSEPAPGGAEPGCYLENAERERPFFAPVAARIFPLLEALAGLPVEPARLDGRACALATVRLLPPGREIPLHRDTYARSPIWERLAAGLDPTTRLSWYVALSDGGGALEVVPGGGGLEYGAEDAGEAVPLSTGDLVLFDAGRLFHRVRAGERERATLGAFVAPARGGARLWGWG